MRDRGEVQSFAENHSTTSVSFSVTAREAQIDRAEERLVQHFKLETKLSLGNMNAFDEKAVIQKYDTAQQLVDAFFQVRLDMYHKRKSAAMTGLERERRIAENRARFVEDLLRRGFEMGGKAELVRDLERRGFDKFSRVSGNSKEKEELIHDFNYLLAMPLESLTAERAEKLKKEATNTKKAFRAMENTDPEQLWMHDLDKLEPHIIA